MADGPLVVLVVVVVVVVVVVAEVVPLLLFVPRRCLKLSEDDIIEEELWTVNMFIQIIVSVWICIGALIKDRNRKG